jgi:hypothetical protein
MSEPGRSELGRIERPEAVAYAGKRKVYLVPLVFGPPDSPAEYLEIARRYWSGARDAVYRLEDRLGICRHVFHQFVTVAGDDGLRVVAQVNPGGHDFVGEKLTAGAALEAFEDEATLAETMDWQMCQMVGLQSPKVQRQVWEAYRDAKRRRYELMIKKIETTLGEGEAALLVVEETHELQFPPEVEVFYVAPPALDELHRWIRDRQRAQRQTSTAAESPGTETSGTETQGGDDE